MTAAELLRAARSKISDPAHWTQGHFARDARGDEISAISDEAICWCARGAIDAVSYYDEDPASDEFYALEYLRKAVLERTGKRFVASFNDSAAHEDVLAAFDRAVHFAEADDALR